MLFYVLMLVGNVTFCALSIAAWAMGNQALNIILYSACVFFWGSMLGYRKKMKEESDD